MNLLTDSLWITENFVSLVEAREARTGEWLGSDALTDPIEGPDEYAMWDMDAANEAVQNLYDHWVYGD